MSLPQHLRRDPQNPVRQNLQYTPQPTCDSPGLWGDYGFRDAFSAARDGYADSYLAIDQGPPIVMIENRRSGLVWR